MDPSLSRRVTKSKILPCKDTPTLTVIGTIPPMITHSSNDFHFEEYSISFDKISTVVTLFLVILGKPNKWETSVDHSMTKQY